MKLIAFVSLLLTYSTVFAEINSDFCKEIANDQMGNQEIKNIRKFIKKNFEIINNTKRIENGKEIIEEGICYFFGKKSKKGKDWFDFRLVSKEAEIAIKHDEPHTTINSNDNYILQILSSQKELYNK